MLSRTGHWDSRYTLGYSRAIKVYGPYLKIHLTLSFELFLSHLVPEELGTALVWYSLSTKTSLVEQWQRGGGWVYSEVRLHP